MSPLPMPEVTCPEPGDVVHYTKLDGTMHRAIITSGPHLDAGSVPRWDLRLFNESGEGDPAHATSDRISIVAKGRDVDERPDCIRCGHFAANHEGGAGVCLAKDDGVYACHCFTYTADPNPGKDPNAPDDLQQDPAHRKPRQCTRCGHPISEHTGRGGCCEDLPCYCYGYSEDPGAEMPPRDAPRMHVVHATLPPVLAAGEDLQAGDPVRLAPEYDVVEKAEHYNRHPSGIECIEVVRHMGFNTGNAIKYVWRADLKGNAIEDLKKARYYLDDEIAKRERQAADE